jgi:D-3-phosphoglycerate dehydrogenase
LRFVHVANAQMHRSSWTRHFGRRIPDVTIGLIGVGRIGRMVLDRLRGFGPTRLLVNDISPDLSLAPDLNLRWVEKDEIYRSADVISLHLPLTRHTRGLIGDQELRSMKSDALLINTSRGGIVDEDALLAALDAGHLGGAAVDVFEQEPYAGPLAGVERCLLTSHMGSMSVDCRTRMEIEATAEAVRLLTGQALESAVPDDEYELQRRSVRERGR